MNREPDLERLREDVEARQRNILREDRQENAQRFSNSLWNGTAESRPSQIVFAFLFMVLGLGAIAAPFLKELQGGAPAAFILGFALWFLSYKLFARSRASRNSVHPKDTNG